MLTLAQMLVQVQADTLSFPTGQTARAVRVTDPTAIPVVLDQIGLQQPRPVLVLVGGASKLNQEDFDRLQQLFIESLAPLAQEIGATVIDGGTDAGVIKLMGKARAEIRATFPLVGVAPFHKIHYPHHPLPDTYPLEPHHTHFILTPGVNWGDESAWIAKIASVLSGDAPSVTVLMNGGNVSLIDVQESLEAGRLVYVVSGTGRLADEIAAAVRNPRQSVREALCPVIQSGLKMNGFALFDLAKPTVQFKTALKGYFAQQQAIHSHR